MRHRLVIGIVLGLGCGPTISTPQTEGTSTSDGVDGTTHVDPPPPLTTSSGMPDDTSDGAAEPTGTTGSGPGEGEACDYLLQDCAPGLKCVRVDLDGNGDHLESICVSVVDDPLPAGEVCHLDPRTGEDDCSIDTFCAPFFPPDGAGVCTNFCSPVPGALTCDAADQACLLLADLEYGCFPECDPLTSVCPAGHVCQASHLSDSGFVCTPTNPLNDGTTGDPCYAQTEGCPPGSWCYQCENGTMCLPWYEYGPGCDPDDPIGCCTEYCDPAGGACSNPRHECLPFFGNGSAGYCGIPEGFDWCDGATVPPIGLCPPPDAEPSYPWCSSFDNSACPEGSINLVGGQCGFCWCYDTCATVDECPVPTTGSAELVCDPAVGCSLLCNQDSDCPNGMDCHFVSGELRCLWQPDAC